MPVPDTPAGGYSESDVRELVARIVDGLAGEDPSPRPAAAGASGAAEAPAKSSVAIGADHGGYALKEKLAFKLRESGIDVVDVGTDGPDSVDYPDYAHEVAKLVAAGAARYGIIVDGAGIGSAMVANKVPGVRAALCYDLSSARNSREHNHANVLTLGAGLIGDGLAWQIVQEWLAVDWGEGRHARRVDMISAIESEYMRTETGL